MKIVYQNAKCETCAHSVSPSKKACRPCLNRNGMPGYVPKMGVEYWEIRGSTWDGKQEIPVVFRRVIVDVPG